MSDIKLDHSEFKIIDRSGSLDISFWTDTDGFRQRRITVSDYHYSYAETLERVYRLPLPVSSLSPGPDEYFEVLGPIVENPGIVSRVVDERIEKEMQIDQKASRARWKRMQARKLVRAQMELEMLTPIAPAGDA